MQQKNFLIRKIIYHSVRKYSCPYVYRPPILESTRSNSVRILIFPNQKVMRIKHAIWRESGLIRP